MEIFKGLTTVLKIKEVLVDNHVWQLHYRVTALLLLGSAALVASRQHFGDPIDCITRDDVPSKLMDTYCWVHGTFTLPDSCNGTEGLDIPHPCINNYVHRYSPRSHAEEERRTYHTYYQWVYFVLAFQAACFYAPHFFWKSYESKLLSQLVAKLKEPVSKDGDKEPKDKIKQVTTYIIRNSGRHQTYFYYFTICEILNFINVCLQIYLIDAFLGGSFLTYGLDVIKYSQMNQEVRADPMIRIFPRMTKCTFHRFGPSGDINTYDALCLLPINIINEKIYIALWFWLVALACITGMWLVYRFLTFTQSKIRYNSLIRKARFTRKFHVRRVLDSDKIKTGDWFLISMVCKNIDPQWFRCLMKELAIELNKRDTSSSQDNGMKPIKRNHDPEEGKLESDFSDMDDSQDETDRKPSELHPKS